MSVKELQDKIVSNLKTWQKVEDATILQTSEIISKTENPVIRMIMEIIRSDSLNHHRVQQLIVHGLREETTTLNTDDLTEVWSMIEKHIEMEKRTAELARACLTSLEGTKLVIPEYFLNYLLEDEEKHDRLLDNLSKIKKGMYP